MKTEIYFTKMVAAGNDFIVVDNRSCVIKNGSTQAKILCDRKNSAGADGLILFENPSKKTPAKRASADALMAEADIRMRIFNPDGSQAQMCGNGVRCLAKFAQTHKITEKGRMRHGASLLIETSAGVISAQIDGDVVKAKLVNPTDMKLHLQIPVAGKKVGRKKARKSEQYSKR